MTEVRTRFAPSPTGHLHLGGLRTAIYSWAYARGRGGSFILRIEDTDIARSKTEYEDEIIGSLRLMGIDWDEEPMRQSDRKKEGIYLELLSALLERDLAYRCYCTEERIDAARKAATAGKETYHYDGRCASLARDEIRAREEEGLPSVVRLRMPREGITVVKDELRGNVEFDNSVLDDLVIMKSDGLPTFHFAVAADDALSGITHVVRGDDHLSNTPKQVRILGALAAATGEEDRFRPPTYVHLPLILGPDGKRFSKRHGATAVREYLKRGILPEALFNFLALLGWSPGDDREILSREEIVSLFDFSRCVRKGAIFDEEKLEWMNGQYIMRKSASEIIEILEAKTGRIAPPEEDLERWGADGPAAAWLEEIIEILKPRSRRLEDFTNGNRYFFTDPDDIDYDERSVKKHLKGENLSGRIEAAAEAVASTDEWTDAAIEASLRGTAERLGVKPAKFFQPVRVLVTGRAASPGLFETIRLVGRKRTLERLRLGLDRFGTAG